MSTQQTRADYRWWMQIASRWADCDAYGHVNNAMYYNWFDTALTTMLIERGILRGERSHAIGLCVSSACEFLAPIHFPETVDMGLRIGRVGAKSLRYELAIFPLNSDAPSATGHFTHVFVDPATRKSHALEDWQVEAVQDLVTG